MFARGCGCGCFSKESRWVSQSSTHRVTLETMSGSSRMIKAYTLATKDTLSNKHGTRAQIFEIIPRRRRFK